MLEESRMDKKSLNRSSQPQSRASAIDCKKNTELTHKPWPRNNKKRDGPGSAPKNEPYRKNAPSQRGRGQVDRRSHPRGSAGVHVGGTPNSRIGEDDEPEIGSVFVPGSKKQNLNHLLNFNFMYPNRGPAADRRGPAPRRPPPALRPHKHEHDLYLRAYCQFVVKEDGDYKANFLDPDVPIKWDEIEEVVVRGPGRSECPICLGAPAAGRAARCGHVYCWPCALHLAAAHAQPPPPCPVCAAPLHVQDMKPTRMIQWDSPAEQVTMRLVRRLRGSTTVEVAPPRGQLTEATPAILPLENAHNAPYCKLFSATKQQVHEILKRERLEIENQILAEIDTTEIVFMEQALEMLKTKEENINHRYNRLEMAQDDIDTVPIIYEKQEMNDTKLDWFDVTDDGAACVETIQLQMEELDVASAAPVNAPVSNLNPDAPAFGIDDLQHVEFPLTECPPPEEQIEDNSITEIDKQNQEKYFYFYQAEDGQQIFLNSLNVRVLNASWGALAAAPPVIRGRVLHRETFSLTEQTRKHMPCTAHLPLYCAFDIVEMDLQPPYVTNTALQGFTEEIGRRARDRGRQQREERRRERAWRRAAEGAPRPDFSSPLLFPPAFSSPPLDPGPLSALDQASSSTSVGSPPSGPSFAKMASASGTWRVRRAGAAAAAAGPAGAAGAGADAEDSAAPRALVLSDAIEAALQAAAAPPASSKKKKSKQKVLFATGMQRTA